MHGVRHDTLGWAIAQRAAEKKDNMAGRDCSAQTPAAGSEEGFRG